MTVFFRIMGRTNKGHNWRARQQKVVEVDSSEAKRVHSVQISGFCFF